MRFANRVAAGRALGHLLEPLRAEHPLILGLGRGGLVAGAEVARLLDAPIDVLDVQTIGAPGHPELVLGGVAAGVTCFNEPLLEALDLPAVTLQHLVDRTESEFAERHVHEAIPPIRVEGRTVVIVDDGAAAGVCVRAAVASLRGRGARRVVFASPMCQAESRVALEADADEVICLEPAGEPAHA